jgi:two-component system, OmpR family, sensor kinase
VTVPIRLRMTAWYVLVLAVVLTAVAAFLVVRLRTDLTGGIDRELARDAAQVAGDVGKEGVPEFRDSAGTVLGGERATAQVQAVDGRVLASYGDAIAQRALLRRPAPPTTVRVDDQRFRLIARATSHRGERLLVVAGQSLAPVERSVGRVELLFLLAGPGALLVTALAGWWLARRALRPVERMTSTAAAIGVDRLEARVPEPRTRDEVAHLARTLNTMLDRIEQGVEEQRRLVADASHELRTPLAAMGAEIDVSLRVDDLSPDARTVLVSARDEVDRLSRTVDDLLTLAAADDTNLRLEPRPADLAALAQQVAGTLTLLAETRGVTLASRGDHVSVRVDPDRFAHAVRNVIENAVYFSPPGGAVVVSTTAVGELARLTVDDDGPGVPAELRERIFDRFFRTDPSRTRRTGGSGLGLAITRELVAAHGGTVRVVDSASGSRFVIELPLRADAAPAPPRRSQRTPS